MNPLPFHTADTDSGDGGIGRVGRDSRPFNLVMKRINPLGAVLCLALFAQGCGGRNTTNPVPPSQKRLHLAFVANSPGEYWAVVNLGCDIAAQQLGNVDVDFRFPAKPTVESQQATVSRLVESGVDGIAISPIDPDHESEFLKRIAAKTLMICADSDAANSQRAAYVGTDNVAAGIQAANLIKTALPNGGKIALFVGYANAQNTRDRLQGIRTGLAGSNLQIANTLEDGQNSAVAEKNVLAALSKQPDLAGVMGISGYHGPALLSALKKAGKVGSLRIVCFDDNSDTLTGIAAGNIYGTIAQNPFQIGKHAIVCLEKRLRANEKLAAATNIFTSSRPLTKDNVGSYIAEQKAISFFLKDKPE